MKKDNFKGQVIVDFDGSIHHDETEYSIYKAVDSYLSKKVGRPLDKFERLEIQSHIRSGTVGEVYGIDIDMSWVSPNEEEIEIDTN